MKLRDKPLAWLTMDFTDETLALEARMDVVHGHVLQLQARIRDVEQRLEGGSVSSGVPHVVPRRDTEPTLRPDPTSTHTPTEASPSSLTPAPSSAPAPAPTPTPVSAAISTPSASAPASTPEHEELDEARMAKLLAAAGGTALLVGLITFVVYAIEQDWLPPGLRFVGAALLSALLTLAAWPIARRGHEPVAGAIGGAGLGAWFGSWLVARHAHELVSGPTTFVALGLGAAACLLIADRLRLRLMAVLATVAACATPVLVVIGSGRLVELMVYQLAVVAGLMVVDARRRWPELPTLALMATWILGGHWVANHDGQIGGAFMLWTALLLVTSAASGWRLLLSSAEAASNEGVHVRARLIVGGLLAWLGAAWVFPTPAQTLGLVTLALAAWHLLLAAVLEGRAPSAPQRARSGSTPFAALGWIQTMAGGAVMLDGPTLAWWWIAMAVVALALPLGGLARLRSAAILLPSVAAVSWVLSHEGAPWALGLGLVAAAVPLLAALIERDAPTTPRTPEPRTPEGADAALPNLVLSVLSLLLWAAVVVALGPQQHATRLSFALVPVAAIVARICWRPSKAGVHLGALLLGLGLAGGIGAVVDGQALASNPAEAPLALAVPLLGIAALAAALIARARRVLADANGLSSDLAGLVCASAGGLVLALGFAATFGATAIATAGVGESLAASIAGLGLLVAGLRLDQESWRHIGLAAIGGACFKVVFFDLAAAALVWRALSFVGLGAVLITGAFAYTRALRRKQPSVAGA